MITSVYSSKLYLEIIFIPVDIKINEYLISLEYKKFRNQIDYRIIKHNAIMLK